MSVDLVEALVSDLRAWQLRCLTTVAARTPMAVDAFRVETGSTQRLLGEGWLPKPGWQAEMNQSIDDRLHALERVRRLERDDRRSSRQDG